MEREITEPVDLCTPAGRLDRDAVGWTRRPLHRCALPGSWGRRKRWDFWSVVGPDLACNITYADVDYVGVVDVWYVELSTRRTIARSATVPRARGLALPDEVGGAPLHYEGNGFEVAITEVAGASGGPGTSGTRLRVAFGDDADQGEAFDLDVLVQRPEGHESLGVVIPWSDRRFQYTTKDVARPAGGTVEWGDQLVTLDPDDGRSWGCLDFGRGKWPYRTRWNWGAGAGLVDGVRVGLQLGGKWTVGTGMTENAVVVDGRLSKVSEELAWTYDRRDWLRPWRVRTPRSDRVDLTFTPVYDKVARLQLGVASQAVDQCFGTWSGTVIPEGGIPLAVDGLFGWAEEATWRW